MVTWKIEDEYAKLDETIISFSYSRKDASTTPPTSINIGDLPILKTDTDDNGLLPESLPGFEILVSILAIIVVSLRRREL